MLVTTFYYLLLEYYRADKPAGERVCRTKNLVSVLNDLERGAWGFWRCVGVEPVVSVRAKGVAFMPQSHARQLQGRARARLAGARRELPLYRQVIHYSVCGYERRYEVTTTTSKLNLTAARYQLELHAKPVDSVMRVESFPLFTGG